MARRHAEIAGGGLAGLTAAAALAQRGWSVRVHERAQSLRSEGFGLTIHANAVRVLRAIGAYDHAAREANPLRGSELRNHEDTTVSKAAYKAGSIRVSRHALVSGLAQAAEKAGAELCFGSVAVATEDAATLVLENGQRLKADLVVVADGINSRIRDSLGLTRQRILKPDGAQRLLLARRPGDWASADPTKVIEWWSDQRRIIYGACSNDEIYIALVCRSNDETGRRVPIEPDGWAKAFPRHAEMFERIFRETDWSRVAWAPFQLIKLKRWSAGSIAVIGDAAHAMPPNLGQGAGCSMMNALSLAVSVADAGLEIPMALKQWERSQRPLTDHTQRWSQAYSALAEWPRILREPALNVLALPWFQRRYRRTANHVPTGTEHLPPA